MCKVVLVSRCILAAEPLVSPSLLADTRDIRFSYDLYTIDIISVIYANSFRRKIHILALKPFSQQIVIAQ